MGGVHRLVGALLALAVFGVGVGASRSSGHGQQSSGEARVDVNSATQHELESLPGVGAVTAKKIIAGRPYTSATDLSKAGISAATIKKITPLITFGGAASTTASSGPTTSVPAPQASRSDGPQEKVDLNSASAAELKELPRVGDATAKKIIAGRPYSSVGDLSKIGVSAATIDKIAPFVTVSSAAASPPAAQRAVPSSSSQPVTVRHGESAASSVPTSTAANSPSPQSSSGMVWVNTDSGVYHKEGSRYYGKTKNGKYMSQADAEKAGYRAAKNE